MSRKKRQIISAWRSYAEEWQDNVQRLREECQPHAGLYKSLQLHSTGLTDKWNSTNISLLDALRSLCVLRKRTPVPVCILRRKWAYVRRMRGQLPTCWRTIVWYWSIKEDSGTHGKWYRLRVHNLRHDVSVGMTRTEMQIM